MKQIPSNTAVFFAVPKGGETETNHGYLKEIDAWLAALNGEHARRIDFVRDERGFMQLEEAGQPVYSGCSLKEDDDAARMEVMAACSEYLSRSYSKYFVTTTKVVFDETGVATSVNGDTDADLCQFYTDAVARGIWTN